MARRRRRSNRPWRFSPNDANAAADLGNVYLRQGRVDEAEKALQRRSRSTRRCRWRTIPWDWLRSKGAPDVAETHFREAIRLQPDLAEAHNNLGNLLAGRQRMRKRRITSNKPSPAIPGMWRRVIAMA